jgi:hypothetical protein
MKHSNHQIGRYPDEALEQLRADLKSIYAFAPETYRLANALMQAGILVDMDKNNDLPVSPRYKGISRDWDTPPHYEDKGLLGASWADDPQNPLGQGEAWNDGRRVTLTGIRYDLNDNGHPLNPYQLTGITGRGCLGQFGPNHAVDNGIVIIKPDSLSGEFAFHALGILRRYEGNAPAFAGGFAKFDQNPDGSYDFDRDLQILSQAEELFEEAVSGSVPVLPEYQDKVEALFAKEVHEREEAGRVLNDHDRAEYYTEAETAIKLQQVKDLDPGFWDRFMTLVASSHECFAGPVLNDGRTTDNAWIESRLAWFEMDDVIWDGIRGAEPVFDYQFVAGDDASGVVAHKLDENLVKTAYASHGPMFMFMAASYLVKAARENRTVPDSVITQCADLLLSPYITGLMPDAASYVPVSAGGAASVSASALRPTR